MDKHKNNGGVLHDFIPSQVVQTQTAGAARQGGITSIEGLTRWAPSTRYPGSMVEDELSDFVKFSDVSALASQSQAAQPTELTPERIYALWKERGGDGAPAALRFARAIEREVAAHIAGTSQATKAQAEPTPEMLRAAVKFVNGIDIYEKVPRGVTEIEEGIYAEVFKAMMLAAPVAKEAPAVLEGYVLVPIEPTPEMLEESRGWLPVGARHHGLNVWRAMIAAAPVSPEGVTE